MKKLLIALLVLGVIFGYVVSLQADSTRTIARKSKVVTSNTLITGGGTVYSVFGYANAANAIFALCDRADASGIPSASEYKAEGGEATQYDTIGPISFGDEGLQFNTGIAVFVVGAYLTVEYE